MIIGVGEGPLWLLEIGLVQFERGLVEISDGQINLKLCSQKYAGITLLESNQNNQKNKCLPRINP